MKKTILCLVALVISLALLIPGFALAAQRNADIVCFGGDLTAKQVLQVADYLDVNIDDVDVITVTIDEERAMLGDYVSRDKIGSRSISSARVQLRERGRGITVRTHNITWVTSKMYAQALTTAGVTDARVTVAAPFEVSGTAALTGILKAYEGIAGEALGNDAKDVASAELVLTGTLADFVGDPDQVSDFISQVKEEVVEQGLSNEEEILPIIENISQQQGISLNAEHKDSIVNLMTDIGNLGTLDLGGSLSDNSAWWGEYRSEDAGFAVGISDYSGRGFAFDFSNLRNGEFFYYGTAAIDESDGYFAECGDISFALSEDYGALDIAAPEGSDWAHLSGRYERIGDSFDTAYTGRDITDYIFGKRLALDGTALNWENGNVYTLDGDVRVYSDILFAGNDLETRIADYNAYQGYDISEWLSLNEDGALSDQVGYPVWVAEYYVGENEDTNLCKDAIIMVGDDALLLHTMRDADIDMNANVDFDARIDELFASMEIAML